MKDIKTIDFVNVRTPLSVDKFKSMIETLTMMRMLKGDRTIENFMIGHYEESLPPVGERTLTKVDSIKIKFLSNSITNIIFENCAFLETSFDKCLIGGCIFNKCSFHLDKIFYTDIMDCTFINCNFYNIDTKGVRLENCHFIRND